MANYKHFNPSDKCQTSLNSGLTLVILDRIHCSIMFLFLR